MKRMTAVFLVLIMVLSFFGCSAPQQETVTVYLLVKENNEQGSDDFRYWVETVYTYDEEYKSAVKTMKAFFNTDGVITEGDEVSEESCSYTRQGNVYTTTTVSGTDVTISTNEYDDNGILIKSSLVRNGKTLSTMEMVYDANGNLLRTVTDDRVTEFVYDDRGNVLKVTDNDDQGTTTQEYVYEDGVLKEYTIKSTIIPESRHVFTYHEGKDHTEKVYDLDGNHVSTHEYRYDGDRLISMSRTDHAGFSEMQRYEYDEFGNRIREERTINGKTSSVVTREYIAIQVPPDHPLAK